MCICKGRESLENLGIYTKLMTSEKENGKNRQGAKGILLLLSVFTYLFGFSSKNCQNIS